MDRLFVARHAESEYNVKALINADPSSPRSPLTQRGERQARSLADRIAADEIDVCVTSRTLRAVQTAETVAAALSIPLIRTPLLDDLPAGIFEDGPVEAFATWMSDADPELPESAGADDAETEAAGAGPFPLRAQTREQR